MRLTSIARKRGSKGQRRRRSHAWRRTRSRVGAEDTSPHADRAHAARRYRERQPRLTYAQLVAFGLWRKFIRGAISDAIQRGLVLRTSNGKASAGADRIPARYALGWLALHDGSAARNRWKAWRSPSPIPGDIKSSAPLSTRANGANRPKAADASGQMSTRTSGQMSTRTVDKCPPGKMNLEGDGGTVSKRRETVKRP